MRAEPSLRESVARAFVAACLDELMAPKPGNVHVFAGGHNMEAQDFIRSAQAAAEPLVAGATVGERIFGAVEATWAAVGQNTNLGIVLLCAPIAQAALSGAADLQRGVAEALAALTVADADLAFRAILRASPAGLGRSPEHDVAGPAQVTLRAAMAAAAERDRIAWQYAHDYSDVFGAGAAHLHAAEEPTDPLVTLRLYLSFLAAFPDSHVARKFGLAAAEALRREAQAFRDALPAGREPAFAAALRFDADLKARGLNPGTSADLTVATLFAQYVRRILARARKNG